MKPAPLCIRLGTALALAAAQGTAAAAAPTAAALQTRSLAASCAACHGTDGRAAQGEAMVPLAGRPKEDIAAQMLAFRDGRRPATVMQQLAKGYTDAQIDAIAAYFAALK